MDDERKEKVKANKGKIEEKFYCIFNLIIKKYK
jgi:hypothetical protein